jgi:hypothetical protein
VKKRLLYLAKAVSGLGLFHDLKAVAMKKGEFLGLALKFAGISLLERRRALDY